MTDIRPHLFHPAAIEGVCVFCGFSEDASWHIAPRDAYLDLGKTYAEVVDIRSRDLGPTRADALRDAVGGKRNFGLSRRAAVAARRAAVADRVAEIRDIENHRYVDGFDLGDEQQRSEWINPGWTARALWMDPPMVAMRVRNGKQPNWLVRFLARWLVGIEWKRNDP